jgi:hypothetical protein
MEYNNSLDDLPEVFKPIELQLLLATACMEQIEQQSRFVDEHTRKFLRDVIEKIRTEIRTLEGIFDSTRATLDGTRWQRLLRRSKISKSNQTIGSTLHS